MKNTNFRHTNKFRFTGIEIMFRIFCLSLGSRGLPCPLNFEDEINHINNVVLGIRKESYIYDKELIVSYADSNISIFV